MKEVPYERGAVRKRYRAEEVHEKGYSMEEIQYMQKMYRYTEEVQYAINSMEEVHYGRGTVRKRYSAEDVPHGRGTVRKRYSMKNVCHRKGTVWRRYGWAEEQYGTGSVYMEDVHYKRDTS